MMTTTKAIQDRVPGVAMPAIDVLTEEQVFPNGTDQPPDHTVLREHFIQEGVIEDTVARLIIKKTTKLLQQEPNLLDLAEPISICGDVHGQYYDLLKALEVGGEIGKTTFLFLGDYVDRGHFSVECVLYLWSLKLNFPENFYLLRGNHECRHLTEYFTFLTECQVKYSDDLYNDCMLSFDALPLAALVNGQFLCLHGGLSPDMTTLDDITRLDRFREPPASGLMCDLLWSDPCKEFGDETVPELYSPNLARGCSYYFTFRATCQFLKDNSLLSVIRAHEAQDEGYRMYRKGETSGFPALITVFSAPNYLDTYRNKGAVLKYSDATMNIRQFNQSPHPYWLPNFMDVFTWSLPFVGEKVSEMMCAVLTVAEESAEKADEGTDKEKEAQRAKVRKKILAIGKMARMFRTLRTEAESVDVLRALTSDGQLPKGALGCGSAGLQQTIQTFGDAAMADKDNEKMPPPHVVARHTTMRRNSDLF
eukprot:m.39666 g.39666  ORF g.39666 m.39666 type:complete len:478 (+) comp10340_c0_seq1:240-1673(+)